MNDAGAHQRIAGYAASRAAARGVGAITVVESDGVFALVKPSGRCLGTVRFGDDGRLRLMSNVMENGLQTLWPMAGPLADEADLKSGVEWLIDLGRTLPD